MFHSNYKSVNNRIAYTQSLAFQFSLCLFSFARCCTSRALPLKKMYINRWDSRCEMLCVHETPKTNAVFAFIFYFFAFCYLQISKTHSLSYSIALHGVGVCVCARTSVGALCVYVASVVHTVFCFLFLATSPQMKCTLFLYLFVYLFACIFHSFLPSHAFTMFAAYDDFISFADWCAKKKRKNE